MGRIKLNHGYFALVDDADVEFLSRWTWRILRPSPTCLYAVTGSATYMHRVLMPGVKEVDHKNRNGLDNRRENLRSVTSQQNKFNQNPTACRIETGKRRKRWRARLNFRGKEYTAYCMTREEAVAVKDEAMQTVFHWL